MKPLLLIPVLTLPLLLAACETTVIERHPRRSVYVGRDDSSYRHHPGGYYRRDYPDRLYRRDVVVEPRATYRPQVEVRYYNDTRGRYYIRDGRRIYVNAGVNY